MISPETVGIVVSAFMASFVCYSATHAVRTALRGSVD